MALLGGVVELAAVHLLQHRLGLLAEPYRTGRSGRLMRAAETLTIAGLAGTALARRNRLASALSGAALLTASALTRFGIFDAGIVSADDPKYTVWPQRERIRAGEPAKGR
jgi:hypothetical protein